MDAETSEPSKYRDLWTLLDVPEWTSDQTVGSSSLSERARESYRSGGQWSPGVERSRPKWPYLVPTHAGVLSRKDVAAWQCRWLGVNTGGRKSACLDPVCRCAAIGEHLLVSGG